MAKALRSPVDALHMVTIDYALCICDFAPWARLLSGKTDRARSWTQQFCAVASGPVSLSHCRVCKLVQSDLGNVGVIVNASVGDPTTAVTIVAHDDLKPDGIRGPALAAGSLEAATN